MTGRNQKSNPKEREHRAISVFGEHKEQFYYNFYLMEDF